MDGFDRVKIFPLRSKMEASAGNTGARGVLPSDTVLQNRYEILRVVGSGGMGAVYCARDRRFKASLRLCAVKEMIDRARDAQARQESLSNFEREANLLASLNHPAVPKIFDYFSEGNRNYLAMEYIDGQNLETVLNQATDFLPEDEVIEWALQLCEVLSYLHAQRPNPVIFRDLKPSNIMLTDTGRVMLVDFGIAKVFQEAKKGTMIGTEGYSAPEQYRGVAEPRTDIYALGATLHHLLTKSDPRLETPFTFHQRPVRQINPSVSEALAIVVMKMLEYEVDQRYQSADEAGEALYAVARPATGRASARGPALPSTAVFRTDDLQLGDGGGDLVWRSSCEDEVRSSPAVTDGLVLVGSYDQKLHAFNAQSGESIWQFATEGGVASSPSVYQDQVYVGSEDGSVYCLETKTGRKEWSFLTGGPVRSSPCVIDGVVYCGSDDHQIYALDAHWSRLLWRFTTWRPVRSSPTVSGDLVYCGSDDEFVYALNAVSGVLKWKFRTASSVLSSPAVAGKAICVGSNDRALYGLDAESGFAVWRLTLGGEVRSSPRFASKRLFVGSTDRYLYCVDAGTGQIVWQFLTGGPITSSPRYYRGAVYVGSGDGHIYSVDSGTGELRWKFKTDGPVPGSPAVKDGIVYVGSVDRRVYALRA